MKLTSILLSLALLIPSDAIASEKYEDGDCEYAPRGSIANCPPICKEDDDDRDDIKCKNRCYRIDPKTGDRVFFPCPND